MASVLGLNRGLLVCCSETLCKQHRITLTAALLEGHLAYQHALFASYHEMNINWMQTQLQKLNAD